MKSEHKILNFILPARAFAAVNRYVSTEDVDEACQALSDIPSEAIMHHSAGENSAMTRYFVWVIVPVLIVFMLYSIVIAIGS